MTIVSNTSPITNLAAIERLDLLEKLYGRVLVPQAVMAELGAMGANQTSFEQIKNLEWIETGEVSNRPLVASLRLELDKGEAESIALALEVKSGLLLMDERRGRRTANRFGLRVIGLLGVLMDAKNKGVAEEIKPILDALINKAGFWISGRLYTLVIETAGEG